MHEILLKLRSVVFCLLILTALLCSCKAQPTWQEQYDLGMRYLTESNYEQAIVAFTAAIEIDPKQPEIYIALAKAYEAIGDLDMAAEILMRGYEETGDESLRPIEEGAESEEPVSLLEAGVSDDLLRFEEVNLLGHSILGLDYNTALSIVQESGFSEIMESADEEYLYISAEDIAGRASFSALQHTNDDFVGLWSFERPYEPFPIGVRDVQLLDSVGTVFSKLGFTNGDEIEEAFWEVVNREYETFDALQTDMRRIFGEFWTSEWQVYARGVGGTEQENGRFSYYDMTICFDFYDDDTSREYSLEFDFGGSWGQILGNFDTENPSLLVRYRVDVYAF